MTNAQIRKERCDIQRKEEETIINWRWKKRRYREGFLMMRKTWSGIDDDQESKPEEKEIYLKKRNWDDIEVKKI